MAEETMGFKEIQRQRRRKLILEAAIAIALALALGILMPLVLQPFRLKLLGRFLALAIAALGLDLIWGYT
ncbi:MAG: urea ABC transporter permease subunit UrtC, partial [Chloroflexaceae bacterium]|nr:urea ABC transporter permease subunit UrtC [Chloroflexaceae bacterium]